ncbi:MAG TPA: hypothetical protein VHV82_05475 [Sporichthyaceae bacterium]|jgi:hypothetical protein|nr:hypothetical protein [Sporichthyaceae bacterium]
MEADTLDQKQVLDRLEERSANWTNPTDASSNAPERRSAPRSRRRRRSGGTVSGSGGNTRDRLTGQLGRPKRLPPIGDAADRGASNIRRRTCEHRVSHNRRVPQSKSQAAAPQLD